MRELNLGEPPNDGRELLWCVQSLFEIERASRDGGPSEMSADSITLAGALPVPVRTFEPSTATLADVIAVLVTLIQDLQNRGPKRTT